MQILFSQNPARRFDCAFLFSNRLASDGKARRFTHRNHLCHIDNKHLSISKRCQFISRTRLVYCRAHQLHDFVHDFWMLIVFFFFSLSIDSISMNSLSRTNYEYEAVKCPVFEKRDCNSSHSLRANWATVRFNRNAITLNGALYKTAFLNWMCVWAVVKHNFWMS